jgi:hypothetical protein
VVSHKSLSKSWHRIASILPLCEPEWLRKRKFRSRLVSLENSLAVPRNTQFYHALEHISEQHTRQVAPLSELNLTPILLE